MVNYNRVNMKGDHFVVGKQDGTFFFEEKENV